MNWQKKFSIRAGLFAMALATAASAWAEVRPNAYESIVDRNPFGLRPPPPPPEPPSNLPPPAPPATVELTGITSLFQKDRALLEITPGPGKPVLKPILSVGERVESVEVVSINVEKNEVVIKNGSIVTNLSLKVAKAGGAAPPPPGGVVPPPGINPAFRPPPAIPQPQAFTPNNAFQNDAGRGGAMTYGAGANPGVSTFGATATPTTGFGGAGPAAYGTPAVGQPSATFGATDGLRGIPSRTVRAQPQAAEGQPVDPAVQYINMRVQELESKKAGRPFPPLPPIPGLNDQ